MGKFVGGLIVAVLALGGIAALFALSSRHGSHNRGAHALRVPGLSAKRPGTDAGAGPRGLAEGSLLRHDAFAHALRRLAAAGPGRLESLRVAPARIDADVIAPDRRQVRLSLTSDDKLARSVSSIAASSSADSVPFAHVKTAAPERLTRQGAEQLSLDTSAIDYINYEAGGIAGVQWRAFFTGGATVQGDTAGRARRAG
jgi:hypothetical protein